MLVAKNTNIFTRVLSALPLAEIKNSEEWMGIYFGNKKIGYVHTTYANADGNQKVIEQSFLKLKIMDQPREVRTIGDALFTLKGSLLSFTFSITSGEVTLVVSGESKEKGIALKIKTGGTTREEFLKTAGPVYISQGLKFFIQQQKIKPGDKYTIQMLDPSILKDARMEIEVLDEETIDFSGKKIKTSRIKSSFMGMETTTWLSPGGEALREQGPMGTLAIRETSTEALNKGWAEDEEMDFILATAVPVKNEISSPDSISYLKMKITGLDAEKLDLNDHRQRFAGNILEIKKELPEEINQAKLYKLPYPEADMKNLLAPTPLIQSDSIEIKSVIKEILGNTTDAVLAVNLLNRWVYNNLKKISTISVPSAIEVLKSRRGDCNEHTVLFTALARAAGIPTKTAAGLVYQKGHFFYHAWAVVYLGHWVTVDPTFNQFPADATHIKLAEGDIADWIKLVPLIGRIQIEILEKVEEY